MSKRLWISVAVVFLMAVGYFGGNAIRERNERAEAARKAQLFLEGMSEAVMGRKPTAAEMEQWRQSHADTAENRARDEAEAAKERQEVEDFKRQSQEQREANERMNAQRKRLQEKMDNYGKE